MKIGVCGIACEKCPRMQKGICPNGETGCLAREKVVAYAAKKFICIADEASSGPPWPGRCLLRFSRSPAHRWSAS
jgi:hypothetical protein